LGRALAFAFADLGANVVIVDVDIVAAEQTVQKILLKGVKSKAYSCDVSMWESVVNLCSVVSQEFGPVDILINNAGLILFKPFMKNSHREMSRLLSVNINSNVWVSDVLLHYELIEKFFNFRCHTFFWKK
jgi:NAD(P)-dependent dehydrogenase (short-subunit alcohol dehydrogenase family)